MYGFKGLFRPVSVLTAALFAAGAGAARADDQLAAPPPAQQPGDVLRIPGLPPVQMPPGVRVFGPNGPASDQPRSPAPRQGAAGTASKDASAASPPEAPKPDIAEPAGRKKILDDLFERLARADDDREAAFLTSAIERVWMRSGSDTADLLMSRAAQAMEAKDWTLTQQVLDKIVAISPDWAEAWNKRATARFSDNDYAGAVEDIAHVLAIEPRQFDALAGLGFILQKMDLDKRALQAFRKALEVNPKQPELRKIVEKLSLEVDGHDI